jgi:hypothetical protein
MMALRRGLELSDSEHVHGMCAKDNADLCEQLVQLKDR